MSYFYTPWKHQKIKGLWFFENPNHSKLTEHAHYRLYNQNTNSGPPFTDQYPPLSFTENGPHFSLFTPWFFLKKSWKRLWKIYIIDVLDFLLYIVTIVRHPRKGKKYTSVKKSYSISALTQTLALYIEIF